MARNVLFSVALLFCVGARAAYTEFFFTNEASQWTCPDMAFTCHPPGVCAFDNLLNKHVCCDSGASDAVCWGGTSSCGSNTIDCGSGENAFCCLVDREECTQRSGQINICWATAVNPVADISADELNATFSSLSSESPSATQLTVDLAAVTATSTSTSSSTDTTSTSSSSPTSSPTSSGATNSPTDVGLPSPPPESSGGGGVSGGAIGGAVVGGVLGLALIGAGIFFLVRRRRAAREGEKTELDSNPYAGRAEYAGGPGFAPQKYAHEASGAQVPVEMPVNHEPTEMEGSRPVGAL